MNQGKSSKNVCLICQEYTDHVSSKCPKIKCKSCGVLGHASKFCPKLGAKKSFIIDQRKPDGIVKIKEIDPGGFKRPQGIYGNLFIFFNIF